MPEVSGEAQGAGEHNKQGKVDHYGLLYYRVSACSDLPMLATIMVEVPNPKHPQGFKGDGVKGVDDVPRRSRERAARSLTPRNPWCIAVRAAGRKASTYGICQALGMTNMLMVFFELLRR